MFSRLYDGIRLLFRKEKEPYLQLNRILGFMPHDLSIYRTALMHKSMHNVMREQGNHKYESDNERLEFLGDAALGSVVADILYELYPRKQEGFLTTLRSKIVRRDTLNKLAVKIGLDKLVLYDERMSNKAHNSYMNGNAFEAFFGAIYLDRGYDYCMRFMRKVIFKRYLNIDELSRQEVNYKSRLIEWSQHYQLPIKFEMVSQKMQADHNTPVFVSRVLIAGIYCGMGEGYSKKESHQAAARQAYNHIKRDSKFANDLRNQSNI